MCGLSCSPRRKDVIEEKLLFKTIDDVLAAKAEGLCDIKQIGFSGGEAFLYPDLLVKGSNYAKERGFTVTVASNGFWGLWANEKIDKILSAARLDTIFFSSDAFHREYVSLEALKGAIAACQRAAIHCSVSVGDAKGKYNAADFIRDLGEAKYYVDLNLYPFYRVGRAENLSEDIFYRLRPIEPRCYDGGALGMRPDGLVFPCCSPAAFDTCLHLGNIRKKSLSDMLRDNPCVDLCNLLQDSESFQKLTSIAVEKGLLTAAQRDLSPCEQCNLMFRKKGYGVLKKYAADLYDELLVKKLFA